MRGACPCLPTDMDTCFNSHTRLIRVLQSNCLQGEGVGTTVRETTAIWASVAQKKTVKGLER